MTKPTISLDDLYSDAGPFDEEASLRILKDRVVFTKESDIVFLVDPNKLLVRDVILLYALAKKVLKLHDKIADELITASEVVKKTKLNDSTISVTIMRLKNRKLLMQSSGGYELPNFKISEVIGLLSGEMEN